MKKFIKVVLIVCICSLIVGSAIVAGSYYFFYKDMNGADICNRSEVVDEEVRIIHLKLTNCNVVINEGSEFSYQAKNVYGPGFVSDVKDGNLTINYDNKENFEILGWKLGNDLSFVSDAPSELIVTVPKDTSMWSVFVEDGIGNINIDSLNTERLVLQLAAGDIKLNNVIVTESSDIQLVSGEVDLGNSRLAQAYTCVGAGYIRASFEDAVSDYDLDLSSNLGTVDYPGSEGIHSSYKNVADRKYSLTAETDSGIISIK